MTDTKDLICSRCKHYRFLDDGCDAFPEGIPDKILLTNEHDKPLPEQKNDLIFEPGYPEKILQDQIKDLQNE